MPNSPKLSYIFVAISFVSTALLYVYFKNKVDKVDEKLDMMYQLIQSHAIENNTRQNTIREIPSKRNSELIEISDSEKREFNDISDSDDSDSDESNTEDTESENETESESPSLVVGEESPKLSDIKTIEVTLNNEQEENLNELTEINLKKMNNEEELEEVNQAEVEESIEDDSVKQEVTDYVENILEEVESDINNVELNTVELNLNNDDDIDEDDNDKSSEKEVDYSSLKVKDLKEICKNKKLTNYAALKKAELIDLLMSSV
jgi:hypothetical protein